MAGIRGPFLWTLLLVQMGFVLCEIQFLEKFEGGSVVLPCALERTEKATFGVYLKRTWLRRDKVLYKYTNSGITVYADADKERISVAGDPSHHAVNVTISRLKAGDTDRYYCEFMEDNPSSEDTPVPGKTEFFLLVHPDVPAGPADIELVQTCAGGSVVLPCLPPLQGERSTVEGVGVTRQRSREPAEVLYNSKHHHGSGSGFTPSATSRFPVEKVHLTFVPGPGGISYNATLQQLQPDDSGLYSCQLQMRGRADSAAGLGRRVFFVSVQDEHCGCSSYSTLLYSLFSAVIALVLLVLIGILVIYKGKARSARKSHPQAPIYEEMTGVQRGRCKLAPNHLEEMETSEYKKKSCPENYYERPTGALYPRAETQK